MNEELKKQEAPISTEQEQARNQFFKELGSDKTLNTKNVAVALPAQEGTTIIQVRDDELSAALTAVGVPYIMPRLVRRKETATGRNVDYWLFADKTSDGTLKTKDLIKAWNSWEKFIGENPEHPFTFAITAVKNYVRNRLLKAGTHQYVTFKHPNGKTFFHCTEGSQRYKEYIMQGLERL